MGFRTTWKIKENCKQDSKCGKIKEDNLWWRYYYVFKKDELEGLVRGLYSLKKFLRTGGGVRLRKWDNMLVQKE